MSNSKKTFGVSVEQEPSPEKAEPSPDRGRRKSKSKAGIRKFTLNACKQS